MIINPTYCQGTIGFLKYYFRGNRVSGLYRILGTTIQYICSIPPMFIVCQLPTPVLPPPEMARSQCSPAEFIDAKVSNDFYQNMRSWRKSIFELHVPNNQIKMSYCAVFCTPLFVTAQSMSIEIRSCSIGRHCTTGSQHPK